MSNNLIIKILCNFIVILLTLYFIPFLGVCLIIFRFCIYKNKRHYSLSVCLIVTGLLLLVPKIINSLIRILKLDNVEIPYLKNILDADIYVRLVKYGKLLITIGVLSFIISIIIKNLYNKLSTKLNSSIQDYIEKDVQKDYEIRKENDLIMQEKREKAKNTHVVKCPFCGSDNMLTEQTGVCKFCRKSLEYKN